MNVEALPPNFRPYSRAKQPADGKTEGPLDAVEVRVYIRDAIQRERARSSEVAAESMHDADPAAGPLHNYLKLVGRRGLEPRTR